MNTIHRFAKTDIGNDITGDTVYEKNTKLTILYCFPSNAYNSGIAVIVVDEHGKQETLCASCLYTNEELPTVDEEPIEVSTRISSPAMDKISGELDEIAKNFI